MRSYSYHDGIWKTIDDPLPRESDSSDFGDIEDLKSPKNTYASVANIYEQALKRAGLARHKGTFSCQIGELEVYGRDHVGRKAERSQKEFPYDFLCILRVAESYIRVWVLDLPNLLSFLREMEAHRLDNTVAHFLKQFSGDADLSGIAMHLHYALEALWQGNLEITVKPPQRKS